MMPFYLGRAYAKFQPIQGTEYSDLKRSMLMECACNNNQILRGAAVNSYIKAFLLRGNVGESNEATKYTCRICGAEWRRVEQNENSRAQLVRTGATSGKVEE